VTQRSASATGGSSPHSLDELRDAINASFPKLTAGERGLAIALYELLAMGRPVTVAELAKHTALDEESVRGRLDAWPGVFRDGDGRVVGFWGLALAETPHRFEIEGRTLYGWCAADPLFLAPLLGTSARVISTCPVTGEVVALTVSEEGVFDIVPPGAILSFIKPDDRFGDDVIERFCHYIHLFVSQDAANTWVADHAGTFVLSIDEAFELGRRTFGRWAGSKRPS
jgi:alkylmercury lyase